MPTFFVLLWPLVASVIVGVILLACYFSLSKLSKFYLPSDVPKLDRKKFILGLMYFTNFLLILKYQPLLILEETRSLPNFFWIWGSVSVVYYNLPLLHELFKSKKDKKEPADKFNIFLPLLNFFFTVGIGPAIILILWTDYRLVSKAILSLLT